MTAKPMSRSVCFEPICEKCFVSGHDFSRAEREGDVKQSKDEGFSPCGAISLSVRLRQRSAAQPARRRLPLQHSLKGRIALVTGASRGIGRSIALSLATAGADMVLNFLTRAAEAKAVEAEILRLGRRCVSIQADVSVASEVQRLAGEAERSMGAVDVLVNNAGIARQQALEQITESDWDELIDVNLKSCFLVTQAFPSCDAYSQVGPHYQHLLGCCSNRWCGRATLCGFEGRHAWADALLRSIPGSGRNHGKCDSSSSD